MQARDTGPLKPCRPPLSQEIHSVRLTIRAGASLRARRFLDAESSLFCFPLAVVNRRCRESMCASGLALRPHLDLTLITCAHHHLPSLPSSAAAHQPQRIHPASCDGTAEFIAPGSAALCGRRSWLLVVWRPSDVCHGWFRPSC